MTVKTGTNIFWTDLQTDSYAAENIMLSTCQPVQIQNLPKNELLKNKICLSAC